MTLNPLHRYPHQLATGGSTVLDGQLNIQLPFEQAATIRDGIYPLDCGAFVMPKSSWNLRFGITEMEVFYGNQQKKQT